MLFPTRTCGDLIRKLKSEKAEKATIDAEAAAVILEDWLKTNR